MIKNVGNCGICRSVEDVVRVEGMGMEWIGSIESVKHEEFPIEVVWNG